MTRSTYSAATSVAVILAFCLVSVARAVVPDSLNYQGYLTNASGAAIKGSTEMMFTIYSEPTSGAPLWSSGFLVVPVDQGLFSVELGGVANPFSPILFNTPLWLGVTIRGEAEMVPRRPLTTVGFAFKADDALSLQGQGPAVFDQSGHVANLANPHAVTSAQTGGATSGDIADLQTQLNAAAAALETAIASLQGDMAAVQGDLAAETLARIDADNAEAATRSTADALHDSAITAIQANTVLALDGVLSLHDAVTARFSGVNLQVVNGTDTTDGTPTGTGNIIVGYNAVDSDPPICSIGSYANSTDCAAAGGVWAANHQSGSHNVVIGDRHNYSRSSGLVLGYNNNIMGPQSSVTGGEGNTASAPWSSVSGGRHNTASGHYASVSGGDRNTASDVLTSVSGGRINEASGDSSSVSGGAGNTASGDLSSVSGGSDNTASDTYTSVSGGYSNTASDWWSSVSGGAGNAASVPLSSVSGGQDNEASGRYASVSGGRNNTASGEYASVSGGGSDNPDLGNHAYAHYSSILGGIFNETGNPDDPNRNIGAVSTISGGDTNRAIGAHSSVSGGIDNTATGFRASVSGGESNEALGTASNVSGGKSNVASGASTSVVGGDDTTCTIDMCGEGVISDSDL